jgi:hypothetical protein
MMIVMNMSSWPPFQGIELTVFKRLEDGMTDPSTTNADVVTLETAPTR